MPSLADLLRSQNFEPNDSLIASSINHPLKAGKKLSDWIARQTQTAAGIPEQYDNPNPLLAPSPIAQSQAAFDLSGLVQGGSMPFAPATKGGTLGSITAWHGSPHKFDKFSMDKIGTGEGAQAYGHGLYFAESPEVAKQYASSLAARVSDEKFKLQYHMDMAKRRGDLERVKELADKIEGSYGKNMYKTSLEWPDPAREASDPLGHQHFLDWDKPLSEQPEHIANAMQNHIDDYANKEVLTRYNIDKNSYGMEVYDKKLGQYLHDNGNYQDEAEFNDWAKGRIKKELPTIREFINKFGNRQGSEKLKELGIPGIRYLDGGSRGAGEGSYNYVIFDDKIPKIKERNGNPLSKLLPATMLGYGMANQRSLSDYFGAQ